MNFESSCLTFAEKQQTFIPIVPLLFVATLLLSIAPLFGNSLSVKMASGDDSVRP